MPPLRVYRLFISHAWQYGDDYYRLKNLLDRAPLFLWRDYSVPQHDPLDVWATRRLEAALREQVRQSQAVIVLAGMYSLYRQWIQREIDMAVEMFKPIVAVRPRGQQRMPVAVQDVAWEVVGWSTASIVRAIRDYAL